MEDMVETKERVCVGAVLVRYPAARDDDSPRVLLGKRAAKRAFYPGVWDVLGGHLEAGRPLSRRWSASSGRRWA